MSALRFYCDTAYIDRTGGFHKLAREQLDHAKRILTEQPDLDRHYLIFKNNKDRDYVCGPVQRPLSRSALEKRLRDVELPPGWGRFRSLESGHAVARITAQDRPGAARIEQGGNMNLWSASVEFDNGPPINTYVDGQPRDIRGE